ncbi:MAG: hypothetical protein Q7R39_02410 [Dehalococcoidia bacterium]|nr:hypothetical protein [Dehalococcoidia bacterium]
MMRRVKCFHHVAFECDPDAIKEVQDILVSASFYECFQGLGRRLLLPAWGGVQLHIMGGTDVWEPVVSQDGRLFTIAGKIQPESIWRFRLKVLPASEKWVTPMAEAQYILDTEGYLDLNILRYRG